jgi:hypothetical protein
MKRTLRTLVQADPRPLEFLLAIQSILYGSWLLLPFDTFGSAITFSIMRQIMPECFWGVVILAIGIIQLVGLTTDQLIARRVLASLDLMTWLTIDVALWLSGSASIAPIFIFTSVLASVLILVELFHQARTGSGYD